MSLARFTCPSPSPLRQLTPHPASLPAIAAGDLRGPARHWLEIIRRLLGRKPEETVASPGQGGLSQSLSTGNGPHHRHDPAMLPDPTGAALRMGVSHQRFVPRVFISHSSADTTFGERLASDLQVVLGDHEAVWYDKLGGLQGGDDWWSRIERELAARNVFVVILSPEALGSPWVKDEIAGAHILKNSSSDRIIVPVLHKPCDGIPLWLRRYQAISFLAPRSYDDAHKELVEAIRTGIPREIEGDQGIQPLYPPPVDTGVLAIPDHFIGRQTELDWILHRLRAGKLANVTALNGMAGIGKTALVAYAVKQLADAREFADGIAVLDCRDQTNDIQVMRQVLARFDPQRREPEAEQERELHTVATRYLTGKKALVVLDNIESTLPIAFIVKTFKATGTPLLMASRESFPTNIVPDEAHLDLELLSHEEAFSIFVNALGSGNGETLDAADRIAVTRIVRSLGYHTLAVKLMAGEAGDRNLRLEDLASELERDVAPALNVGQHPVGTVLEKTCALLPDDVQHLFVGLAGFATADFGRQAVTSLARSLRVREPDNAIELLVRRALVDASVRRPQKWVGDRERLHLHPLVRAYIIQQFKTWPEATRDRALSAIASHYADYTTSTDDRALGIDEANITGALEWALGERRDALVSQLCAGMQYFWRDRSRLEASLHFLPLGIQATEHVGRGNLDLQRRAVRMALTYGVAERAAGNTETALNVLHLNLRFRREMSDKRGEGIVLFELGQLLRESGDASAAMDSLRQALEIQQGLNDPSSQSRTLGAIAQLCEHQNELDAAENAYTESLDLGGESADMQALADARLSLGRFLIERRNQRERGCEWIGRAVDLYAQEDLPGEAEARALAAQLGCPVRR